MFEHSYRSCIVLLYYIHRIFFLYLPIKNTESKPKRYVLLNYINCRQKIAKINKILIYNKEKQTNLPFQINNYYIRVLQLHTDAN